MKKRKLLFTPCKPKQRDEVGKSERDTGKFDSKYFLDDAFKLMVSQ